MEILSNKQEKLIRLLQQKKYRKQEGLFVVEGKKMIDEALQSDFNVEFIATEGREEVKDENATLFSVDSKRMKKISSLTNPPGILAVIQKNKIKAEDGDLILVLDEIKDPGNLGTIIRTAEAFGIRSIVCSKDTVDCYSPKVVQATMGAIFRMNISYTDLLSFIKEKAETYSVYASHLMGKNLYETELIKPSILVMGNESNGISDELMKEISNTLKIPMAGQSESFNVSIATAILLSEFKRQFAIS